MTPMPGLISICIPSRNRPSLLIEAVQSCFKQAYRPLEVLVGDDSTAKTSQHTLAGIAAPRGITLRYTHNRPPLGQAGNVNALFAAAAGERFVLLHDDDVLPPGAVDRLAQAWDAHADVVAVFGKMHRMFQDGTIDEEGTAGFNRSYYRTAEWAGPQESAVVSALRQQFPGAGYLVQADLARTTGFRSADEVSEFLDMDFGIRLALAAEPARFLFLDSFTYQYRRTPNSISQSSPFAQRRQDLLYDALSTLELPARYEPHRREALHRISARCLPSYALAGRRRAALRLFFSPEYNLPRYSPRALYHLLGILVPRTILWRERWRRQTDH